MSRSAKRFGWWLFNGAAPMRSLRRAFPEKSDEGIRKYLWPELQRAARNYELASRVGGVTKYLLGKPFDRLTREQMCELATLWPRDPRPLQPIRFLPYVASPDVTATLRRLASEDSLPLSNDTARDARILRRRATKRAEETKMIEKSYAQAKGWTVPQYLTVNLAECSNRAILEAFQRHVAAQRDRLQIASPNRNKGRANRSARGLSFHKVEALDVRTHLRREDAKASAYDSAQARAARREAKRLLQEWAERKLSAHT